MPTLLGTPTLLGSCESGVFPKNQLVGKDLISSCWWWSTFPKDFSTLLKTSHTSGVRYDLVAADRTGSCLTTPPAGGRCYFEVAADGLAENPLHLDATSLALVLTPCLGGSRLTG